MGVIRLNKARFFAPHGFYEKEREEGNSFEVDIEIHCPMERAGKEDDLEQTIDYQEVYNIIAGVMKGRSVLLLESLGINILDQVYEAFSGIEEVTVSIRKLNPPLGGECASSEIILKR